MYTEKTEMQNGESEAGGTLRLTLSDYGILGYKILGEDKCFF